MARTVRVEYEGAIYPVLCRGDRRERIFKGDPDRELFLATLGEVCERTGFRIHSDVLMSNHDHLLLETPEANPVAGMKRFQGTYTQRYNARHRQSGHLFQGRYKAIPVEEDEPEYVEALSDYIHLNPVRAHLPAAQEPRLEAYLWSSYPRFIGLSKLPEWLCREQLFDSMGLADEGLRSRRSYARRMEEKVGEALDEDKRNEWETGWEALRKGWCVGGENFRDRLLDRVEAVVKGRSRSSYRSDGLQRHDEQMARQRLEAGLRCLGIPLAELVKRKQTDPVKQAIAWHVKRGSTVGDAWICEILEMGCRTNIHRAASRYRNADTAPYKTLKRKLLICAD